MQFLHFLRPDFLYRIIGFFNMAERRGFEPLRRVTDLHAFQACPFSLLGTSPYPIFIILIFFIFAIKLSLINVIQNKKIFPFFIPYFVEHF